MGDAGYDRYAIERHDPILVTGATGFIGLRLVKALLNHGFRNLRCFARPFSRGYAALTALSDQNDNRARLAVIQGNLLSREDCAAAAQDAALVFHLAAGRGEKSFPDAFMNSVVTTRNLLEASRGNKRLRRFVSMSSFAVYSNISESYWRRLDETSPVESSPELTGDAYSFAKIKQDEIVQEYGKRFGIPYVIVRPGYVYGPGTTAITGRVGIDTFGVFLHLGGTNKIPFTYIDNCVDAIILAGLKSGIDGEVFNVVDDELPSSWQFLRQYKRNVRTFKSLYIPHPVSYALCYLWEKYSTWSRGQLPPVFNVRKWRAFWKKTRYSNRKAKAVLGWEPRVTTRDGLQRYFDGCCRLGE